MSEIIGRKHRTSEPNIFRVNEASKRIISGRYDKLVGRGVWCIFNVLAPIPVDEGFLNRRKTPTVNRPHLPSPMIIYWMPPPLIKTYLHGSVLTEFFGIIRLSNVCWISLKNRRSSLAGNNASWSGIRQFLSFAMIWIVFMKEEAKTLRRKLGKTWEISDSHKGGVNMFIFSSENAFSSFSRDLENQGIMGSIFLIKCWAPNRWKHSQKRHSSELYITSLWSTIVWTQNYHT